MTSKKTILTSLGHIHTSTWTAPVVLHLRRRMPHWAKSGRASKLNFKISIGSTCWLPTRRHAPTPLSCFLSTEMAVFPGIGILILPILQRVSLQRSQVISAGISFRSWMKAQNLRSLLVLSNTTAEFLLWRKNFRLHLRFKVPTVAISCLWIWFVKSHMIRSYLRASKQVVRCIEFFHRRRYTRRRPVDGNHVLGWYSFTGHKGCQSLDDSIWIKNKKFACGLEFIGVHIYISRFLSMKLPLGRFLVLLFLLEG